MELLELDLDDPGVRRGPGEDGGQRHVPQLPLEQGLQVLAKQGVEVLVGAPPTGTTIQVPPGLLVQGERRIVGSRYGSGNPRVEFPKMVELAMAGEQARGLIVF